MLENLLQLVRDYGQKHVVDNPDVPNEQNNAVMAEASGAVTSSIQQALASGNIAELVRMFNSDNDQEVMANPVAQNAQSGFIENITNKLGINRNTALTIGASLLPIIMSQLVRRTRSNAPQDSGFDLSNLIGSLTGGAGGGGIGNLISRFTGSADNTGGGPDMEDMIRQISSGARERQQEGGIGSLIKNFFN